MNKKEIKLIEETLKLLDGICVFWACDGPDKEPVDMKTCRVCNAVRNLRHLLKEA